MFILPDKENIEDHQLHRVGAFFRASYDIIITTSELLLH